MLTQLLTGLQSELSIDLIFCQISFSVCGYLGLGAST